MGLRAQDAPLLYRPLRAHLIGSTDLPLIGLGGGAASCAAPQPRFLSGGSREFLPSPRRQENRKIRIFSIDYFGISVIIIFAVRDVETAEHRICSSIEVVITSTIGNRVAAKTAREFESLLLRQKNDLF